MKVIKWLDEHFEEFMLGLLICMVTAILFLQIIMRYVFKSPLVWSDEAARYCFVIAAFLSPGYCVRQNVITRVDFVSRHFPPKVQKVISFISWILMVFLFAWLLINCREIIQNAIKAGRASTAMQIPMQYLYMVPAFGFALAIFRILEKIYRTYLKPDSGKEEEKK